MLELRFLSNYFSSQYSDLLKLPKETSFLGSDLKYFYWHHPKSSKNHKNVVDKSCILLSAELLGDAMLQC